MTNFDKDLKLSLDFDVKEIQSLQKDIKGYQYPILRHHD